MKIYTRKGDQGKTSLFGGGKYSKDDLRIEAYGTLDELNAFLGHLRDLGMIPRQDARLLAIQHQLFNLGANLATKPGNDFPFPLLNGSEVKMLEEEIDEMEKHLDVLKTFILPGGHPQVSWCHICRTVCRRAERRVVSLSDREKTDPGLIIYLNRLSDYLFVLARTLAVNRGVDEIKWQKGS